MVTEQELHEKIDACFAEEMRAARDEYSAVLRNNHAAAALAHRDRWHWLSVAEKLIEQLPHMQ